MARAAVAARSLSLATGLMMLPAAPALAFDYARYQVADLDDILAQPRPKTGFDVNNAKPLRLEVTLVSYDETCAAWAIPLSMRTLGFPQGQIDNVQATRCIKVRSAKGKEALLFIQDVVRAFLPREVPLGGPLTLFAIHLFTTPDQPGLLVNEFEAPDSGTAVAAKEEMSAPCGCGAPEFHPGVDMTMDKEGAPVGAMDDGIVLRVEQDDQATVEAFGIGRCGRYVVVKHSYPNGHLEIGPSKTLHLEIRPVTPGTLKTDASWQTRYGGDPSMDWSRYDPVDPYTFDADVFGGRSSKP